MTYIKLHSGENWYPVPLKMHDGKGWKQAVMKRFNGTSWEKIHGASDQEGIYDMTYYVAQSEDDGQQGYNANTNASFMDAGYDTFQSPPRTANGFAYLDTQSIPTNAKIISARLNFYTLEIYKVGIDNLIRIFTIGNPEEIEPPPTGTYPNWEYINIPSNLFYKIEKGAKTLFQFWLEQPSPNNVQRWRIRTFDSPNPPYLEVTYSIGI